MRDICVACNRDVNINILSNTVHFNVLNVFVKIRRCLLDCLFVGLKASVDSTIICEIPFTVIHFMRHSLFLLKKLANA